MGVVVCVAMSNLVTEFPAKVFDFVWASRDKQFGYDCFTACLLILVCIAVGDFLLKTLIGPRFTGSLRWFGIHALANAAVVVMSLPAMYQWVSDPAHSAVRIEPGVWSWLSTWCETSHWPTLVIISIHSYHVLAFSGLTFEDYWHHFLFVPVVGIWGGLSTPDSSC